MLYQSDKVTLAVRRSRETISRVARQLIQEKKQKIQEDDGSGKTHSGRDLLSLLRMFFIQQILSGDFRLILVDSHFQRGNRSPT